MSDDKKTIQFNSSLMSLSGGSKTKKNRKIKKEKPKPVIKPNQLKKDLLEKIKKHQQNEKIKTRPTENGNIETNSDSKFHSDFVGSMEYLNTLSTKENAKKKRRNKTLRKPTPHHKVGQNVSFDTSQMVLVDLPTDFDSNISHNTIVARNEHTTGGSDIATTPYKLEFGETINTPFNIPSNILSNIPPNIPSNIPSNTNITNIVTMPNKDTPYGCLKGGTKPTYRQFHSKTIKHRPSIHNSSSTNHNLFKKNVNDQNVHRKDKLQQLKNNHISKIRQRSRNTKRTRYTLGKRNNNISILIKNNKTRRNIKREQGLLKQKPLQEVKKYLYDKNLLKIGSTAPNDILRTLYEQSILAGDITNINTGVTLHNFMQK